MENNGVNVGDNILKAGILSVLFEKGLVKPEDFKIALFDKVDKECSEKDKKDAKDFISNRINDALDFKIK